MAESIISPGVYTRENDISFIQPAPIQAGAAIVGPTVKGPVEIPTVVTSYGDFTNKFGEVFVSGSTTVEYLTSIAVRSYFQQGGTTLLLTRVVSGSSNWAPAASTNIATFNTASINPFTLETLGKGAIFNNSTTASNPGAQNSDNSLVSGSADNLRWEIANINNNTGTFSVLVRRGDDNVKSKTILETFNNVSLDPDSPNYIASVIGNQKLAKTVDSSGTVFIQPSGEYPNNSNYVRVSSVNIPTYKYLATDGVTVNKDASSLSYSASLPMSASGAFFGAVGNNVQPLANYNSAIVSGVSNVQGLSDSDYADAVTLLGNKDNYQFNIITVPGLTQQNNSITVANVLSLVETRGDAIAVVDLVGYGDTISDAVTTAAGLNSSYGASYWPWVQVTSATGKNVFVPASVTIPGVYAFTDLATAPWFAPAGLTRGGISGVIQTERKLSKSDRDALYLGKVNPIATFPGTGISIFGQKTLQTKASALDRVNVRRLLIELKKFIGNQATNLVFEQNTISTRNKFLAAVNPYLESVVQRQGLYSYQVIMDDTNNTADVIDRNQLVGQIIIQPAKTIEFVVLDFTIEPTGATFA